MKREPCWWFSHTIFNSTFLQFFTLLFVETHFQCLAAFPRFTYNIPEMLLAFHTTSTTTPHVEVVLSNSERRLWFDHKSVQVGFMVKKSGIETRSYLNTWALPYLSNPTELPTHI